MYRATIFTECGESKTACGLTPERAIEWAENELFSPTKQTGFRCTYRPIDGVIFRNGKPCGVVYRSW
jgi:hypothetical protein